VSEVDLFCPGASKACSLFVSLRSKRMDVPKKEIFDTFEFNNIMFELIFLYNESFIFKIIS